MFNLKPINWSLLGVSVLLAGGCTDAPSPAKQATVQPLGWARNDIDRFVLAKRAEIPALASLKPAPEADRATLLRRVTMDLTGLPPTPAELDAFLADRSPNAYEKVVDQLLRSPHYGERQAVDWLDLARYADTNGYQDDNFRIAWPYRDWVIRAFNRNLSFDRFITWQLAGDLLPPTGNPAHDRQRVLATAFNRMHQQNQEGGIIDEEYRVEYVADRTNTFGKAMLGLTVECARCHDHKYDPISQKDYYSLFAFFNNVNERGEIPHNGEAAPTVTLTDFQTDTQLRGLRRYINTLRNAERHLPTIRQNAFLNWQAQLLRSPDSLARLRQTKLIGRYSFEEADSTRLLKNGVSDSLRAKLGGDKDNLPRSVPGRFGRARFLPGDSYIELPKNFAYFERTAPFSLSFWVNVKNAAPEARMLLGKSNGPFEGNRGYLVYLNPDGRLNIQLNYVWPDNCIDLVTDTRLPLRQWVHLAVVYDGTSRADGVQLWADGRRVPLQTITDNLRHSIMHGPRNTHYVVYPFKIGHQHNAFYKDYAVDELQLFGRPLTPLELPALAGRPDALLATLQTPAHRRSASDQRDLIQFYLTVADPAAKLVQERLDIAQARELALLNGADQITVMNERPTVRPTFLLKRGVYDAPGETVSANTPAGMIPFPESLPRNRLGLAQWLLLPEHPLFSRVVVNRVWQQYFGQGLVRTSDDFGNQGSLPSHPELLDFLAVRFRTGVGKTEHGERSVGPEPSDPRRRTGWNLKALHRLIVTSATYRQSSTASTAAREADSDNTYLTRGPSYRLSAEQVRDNVLAASGLLNRRIGGPSVYPYQPGGIWEALVVRGVSTYRQQHGDSLYRRSMYTIWKRSAPPPMMLNFDVPDRSLCTVKRQKTSTPLQALVTMNDPQFVEAARVLAQRTLTRNRPDSAIIDQFFRAIVSRPARPSEINLLVNLYREELQTFQQFPGRATTLLQVGEFPVEPTLDPAQLAAWTVVASTVMNVDEAVMKR